MSLPQGPYLPIDPIGHFFISFPSDVSEFSTYFVLIHTEGNTISTAAHGS